jgi:hypothetical protein
MQIIQLVLKDERASTEMETVYALRDMQKENKDLFGDRVRPKSFRRYGSEKSSLEYTGHFCGSHDVPNTFYFDKSGVLEKNVLGFYVISPDGCTSAYYDVKKVMKGFEIERSRKNVASAMESMF